MLRHIKCDVSVNKHLELVAKYQAVELSYFEALSMEHNHNTIVAIYKSNHHEHAVVYDGTINLSEAEHILLIDKDIVDKISHQGIETLWIK